MSIASLVAAIDGVSKETRQEVRRSYMIATKHGVKQIGDRLAAIEKRLDALEKRELAANPTGQAQ
jgi:hypothetical protein